MIGDQTVRRAHVVSSRVGSRTIVQVQGLDGEAKRWVELLLPPGFSARPAPGSDVLLLQVLGDPGHIVAVMGDGVNTDPISDLAEGEFGTKSPEGQIVHRTDHIEITATTKLRVIAPRLECTGDIVAHCDSGHVGLSTHTHAHSVVPDPNT